jgi:hypothetical protein
MAQTELILRLLKDNKIVGYEYRSPFSTSTKIIYIHHFDKLPIDHSRGYSDHSRGYNTITGGGNVIYYDSFELGIKVGDEWFFDGDLVDYGDGVSRNLILYITTLGELEHVKRIGTIHDEGKDA